MITLANRRIARNLHWGGGCFGAAGGQWDLGAKPPAAGGWGFGSVVPSRRRREGLGGGAPSD